MSFATRAVISLPSGIGAGLLGFWAVWRCLVGSVWDHVPGPGYDGWFLAGIFVPGVVQHVGYVIGGLAGHVHAVVPQGVWA